MKQCVSILFQLKIVNCSRPKKDNSAGFLLQFLVFELLNIQTDEQQCETPSSCNFLCLQLDLEGGTWSSSPTSKIERLGTLSHFAAITSHEGFSTF